MKTRVLTSLFAVLAILLLTATITIAGSSSAPVVNRDELSFSGAPSALGSTIGYQGQLLKGGDPVEGLCDFQFSLWDALSGPSQVGSTQSRNAIIVTNGVFMVDDLDFGANAFNGNARWLEIAVKCPGDPSFNTLPPRSPIQPTPYALYSSNSDMLDGKHASAFLHTSGGSLSGNLTFTTGVEYKDFEIGVEGVGVFPNPVYSWFVIKDPSDSVQPLRLLVRGDNGDVVVAKNLGVGTDLPKEKLHVMGISKFEPGSGEISISTPGSWPGFIAKAPNGHRRDIRFRNEGLQILTNSSDALPTNENGINIDESGNVGIGVWPGSAAKLYVAGTSRTEVLQITGGSDLAEPFDIAGADNVEPGMVVAIDPLHAGQLRIADQEYDQKVAGCVSGANGVQPGLVMQQEGTAASGAFPVSLTGRVYCLADASYGTIQPGDLLTTSDTPGHTMLVSDYERARGAVIGKAMSALTSGRGLILVLVTLQ